MSTRYKKKIYGDDTFVDKDSENVSDVEILSNNVKSKPFNVFDLLNQDSENENENNDADRVSDDVTYEDSSKLKKKKKKRKKTENAKNQQKQESNGSGDEIDEIERSVREVNKLLGEPTPGCSNQADLPLWIDEKSKERVLTVQHKHLNPYNELKRIFGSKTVQAEQSKRRNRDQSKHLKKTWLAAARDVWPGMGKTGLSMSIDRTMDSIPCSTSVDSSAECPGNIQYFVFEHSPSYKETQYKFLQAVESLNPENVTELVRNHPYHIDALLQLVEYFKLGEDLPLAAEFTERALYCLECAFHPLFNVTTARCRLDYRKQQNRAFFITLFKHLTFIGGKGCYRTSLEFAKLLLSLDPEGDPLAIVLSIDFYALRAREYKWFVDFYNLWNDVRNLNQLPNIAYNLALAYFHLGNMTKAYALLENALIMFPGVLMPLLDKCGVQPDVKVMNHEFFNAKAQTTASPALEKLQNLFIIRNFHLWKEAYVLPWLERAAHAVLDRVDAKNAFVRYCKVKRKMRYQGKLPRNILRHIILADIKDVIVNGEEIANDGPLLSHDPLPPVDSIDIYKMPQKIRRTTLNNSSSVFSLFFSSMFVDIDETAASAINGLNIAEDPFDEHS